MAYDAIIMAYDAIAVAVLRIVAGIIFIAHGIPKLKDIAGTAEWLKKEGFEKGTFWAFALGSTEVLGGSAIILGLLTKIAAALLAITMLTAIYKHKFAWKQGLVKGYELPLLLLVICIVLLVIGPGRISLDGFIADRVLMWQTLFSMPPE